MAHGSVGDCPPRGLGAPLPPLVLDTEELNFIRWLRLISVTLLPPCATCIGSDPLGPLLTLGQFWLSTEFYRNKWRIELLNDQGGDRREVNESRIKLFSRRLCPKIKTLGNIYTRRWWKHFPTAEKWSQQNYKTSRRRIGSIRLTVSKLRSKQSSNVAAENIQWICLALDQICAISSNISDKSTGYVQPTQKLSSQLWFLSYETPNWMKPGHTGHLKTWNTFTKEFFPNPNISLSILD
jgi:hypothetical protein